MPDIDVTIIGAGVIGLAIARRLAKSGRDVLILERNGLIGSETSSRNSEVIHAGIYYKKNSLKAQLCVEGRDRLYRFCQNRNVPFRKCGKLIVASDETQSATLHDIQCTARENGVSDLRLIGKAELREFEPELSGAAALLSPSTGIIDSHAFMLALLGEAEAQGAQLCLRTEVKLIEDHPGGGFRIMTSAEDDFSFTSVNVVIAAGLHSSALAFASRTGLALSAPVTRFAKGCYFRLATNAPFSRLIYPIPEPGGLGVHLTLDLGGQARFGPDVEWVEALDYEVDQNRAAGFYSAIRKYWPELPDDSLTPDYSGIRPKLSGPGQANADFHIVGGLQDSLPGLIGLFGIESPGLTASLAIAAQVEKRLGKKGLQ